MIVNGLLNIVYWFMDLILFFEIPSLPASVQEYLNIVFDYLSAGAGIVANYCPLGYCMDLFAIILVVDGSILLYKLAMWVVRKIPILGIS